MSIYSFSEAYERGLKDGRDFDIPKSCPCHWRGELRVEYDKGYEDGREEAIRENINRFKHGTLKRRG